MAAFLVRGQPQPGDVVRVERVVRDHLQLRLDRRLVGELAGWYGVVERRQYVGEALRGRGVVERPVFQYRAGAGSVECWSGRR